MIIATISNESLGTTQLVGVTPDYYGADKMRHDTPQGYKYEVVLPAQRYERLTVKIPGAQLLETPLSGHEPTVEFADLRVKPYVDHAGRLAFTASATGIKVIGTDVGGKSPVKG